ncbi:hypothetical protein SAMD00019534_090820 [Acytostelium subglobosum LB1]|uniref:hypothetical protein n=1 Tax=Acytostelium subglobosum LB1 TaxID=1410327 RepID=UPI0006449390|nr:hypothetical protein SAMD00019534_090820 [Acytostelium subglobosum LB1]GAM25907.1 hypothetical protein SAMD00019534_090820 [Acytostelium subglobosum LB1]|eukprot:XP_012750950.1 hypothetical protein SAMD00019534_090820 [Acytostelium subglobosum LB1]
MFKLQASLLPLAYGIITMSSFILTLIFAYYLHFARVTRTHCGLYEFLPSISSTIGDFSPEMNIYRYGMALTSGLRLGTIYLNHYLAHEDRQTLLLQSSHFGPSVHESVRKLDWLIPVSTVLDVLRVFAAGGWIYISSSEHLFAHQIGFVSYVIFSFAFMYTHSAVLYHTRIKFKYNAQGNRSLSSLLLTSYSSKTQKDIFSWKWKVILGITHFLLFVGSLKYFVDHTFYCVYLSYSKYSIFEWLLAFTNVGYDTLTFLEFDGLYFTLHRDKKDF